MDAFILSTSLCASLSTYHQIFRIIKNKSSDDISFIHVSAVFLNMISHLIYGVKIHNQILSITFGNGVAATGLLLLVGSYYLKFGLRRNNMIELNDIENK
jgi:uncharacterized protein with PQ loop repeat